MTMTDKGWCVFQRVIRFCFGRLVLFVLNGDSDTGGQLSLVLFAVSSVWSNWLNRVRMSGQGPGQDSRAVNTVWDWA